jgi:hypothetical protein
MEKVLIMAEKIDREVSSVQQWGENEMKLTRRQKTTRNG